MKNQKNKANTKELQWQKNQDSPVMLWLDKKIFMFAKMTTDAKTSCPLTAMFELAFPFELSELIAKKHKKKIRAP